jgi:hypothetical protein
VMVRRSRRVVVVEFIMVLACLVFALFCFCKWRDEQRRNS